MTVAELIEHLKKFPPDTLVVRGHHYDERSVWKSMDGWWPQMVTLVTSQNAHYSGRYWEAKDYPLVAAEDGTIDALEI